MKKLMTLVLTALGFAAANAGTFPEGFTPLKYISSDDSAQTWKSGNKVGPYVKLTNADGSNFQPEADDTIEAKYRFNEQSKTGDIRALSLFCVRSSDGGRFVFMRTDNASTFACRYDYGNKNTNLANNKLNDTSDHVLVANAEGLTVDGEKVATPSSTPIYVRSANPLYLLGQSSASTGLVTAGNRGTARLYYFRVKKSDGSYRMNLVPMLRNSDSKPGFYDVVSGQFFTNASTESGEFTYGSAGMMDRIAAATAFCGATDPAAEGGDYVFKDGNDYIHVFSSVGEGKSFMVTKDRTAQILVVGGGAGGSIGNGGSGGSAGELKTESAIGLASGAYTIAVGAGGVGTTNPGSDGTASSLIGGTVAITAEGGKGHSKTDGAGDGGDGAGGLGGQHSGNTGGNGGAAVASSILGWAEAFAGGGGGGGQFMTSEKTAGGSVVIDGTTVMVGGRGYKGNRSGDAGATCTGSGGGGGGQNYTNGGTGGSGIVIIRLSKTNVEISGEISMPDWTEGETESEPTGLTVAPAEAQSAFAYKYYANADCTEAIQKPSTMGVYYVRGEVAESDVWNPAVSAAVEFKILPAGGGKEIVKVPTITTEFTYTGAELSPVEAGEHYELSGDTAKTLAGNYTATLALEDTEKYMWSDTLESDPKEIKWTITRAVNKWMVEPSIDKTVWKSTETPGKVTPPVAQFGEPKAQIARKVNGEYADWTDWDGETMPTEKGKYKIRWLVAELADGYTSLESGVEFLIDYRYEPTAPFMVSADGGKTWAGKNTIDEACTAATGANAIIEVCEDVSTSSLSSSFSYKTVTLRSNIDEDELHMITLTGAANFEVFNSGKLILSNIVFDLPPSANVARLFVLGENNTASATLEIQAGTMILGKTTGPLIAYNYNHGSLTLSGGTFRNLSCGETILSAPPDGSFTVKNLTIENCTVTSGALISVGNKTLDLSNVTITNNVTSAGAITVGTEGVIKVSGDVIVKDNKVGDDAKNIVLKNAANLQMVDALGANAFVGVSFGEQLGDVFGSFTKAEPTKGDMKTASAFKNDADAALSGKVNGDNELIWWKAPGLLLIIN